MNKFFLDSSIIIEAIKKHGLEEAKKIYSFIDSNIFQFIIFTNIVVIDEVVYFFIKNKDKVPGFDIQDIKDILDMFEYLEITKDISDLLYEFIGKYKLRNHDALILATCKFYNINSLISLDSDFVTPCNNENIELIDSVEKLKELI